MKEIIEDVIKIATNESEDKVREVGDNMGKRVNEYQKADTLSGVGYAWCASFLAWCLKQAGKKRGRPVQYCYSASCDVIMAWANENGVLHNKPEPGDFFLRLASDNPRDAIHTGVVTRVDGAEFHTVEGNTNLNGSSQGIGVFSLKRNNGSRYRFVRWADLDYAEEASKPTPYKLHIGPRTLETQMLGESAFVKIRDWGEALGFDVEWNHDAQAVLFDGREVPVQVHKFDKNGWGAVRKLAEFSGLILDVDGEARTIRVKKSPLQ